MQRMARFDCSTLVPRRFSVGSSEPYACGFQEKSEKMKHEYLQS